ncbi:MAG TPA: tryptophan-rich sensory protein [Leptolyngbyaceae cyanobacterium]
MTESTHQTGYGKGLAIATLVTIFATIVITQILNIIPPPGGELVAKLANGELSGVLILPANYAFAIWGFVYIGIIAYGFYQLQPNQRQDSRFRQIDILLIVACLCQIAWMVFFPLRLYWVAVVAMLGILLPLIGIYLKLDIGKTPANRKERWRVRIPFSTYLAWISVASIVNIASALFASGWDGAFLNGQNWTVVMLIVGAVIAAIAAVQRGDTAFVLTFVWAYVAIAIRHNNLPAIWITALVASGVLLALLALGRKKQQPIRESQQGRSATRV